ncbi:hypothetical protein niasHS_006600 [Heterodera schachtii]|uniref:Flavodoxin-like domain-containing protein n=1 Tax=Heterodera schachtii TaxID=97005 RepID=A0ABD2JHQ2_HETSC
MLPPDSEKGFNFRKPAGGAHPSAESLSTIQKVIRYAEKDDLLLYVTAAFGIFMPAVMYFFYRYMHNRFKQAAKKKKLITKQTSPENERRTVIFYFTGGANGKQFAYKLADSLQRFDPLVAKIGANELEKARWPKTIQIFVLSDEDAEGMGTQFAEFVDWLDEIRYEHRKRNYLRGVRFCTVHLANCDPSTETNKGIERTVEALEKRLHSLSATSLYRHTIVSKMDDDKSEERRQLEKMCTQFERLLCRFYYGEFDGPDETHEKMSVSECSASEGSD